LQSTYIYSCTFGPGLMGWHEARKKSTTQARHGTKLFRVVLGPRPRPTGGHEPGPFKQARKGPNQILQSQLGCQSDAHRPPIPSFVHGLHEAHLGLALCLGVLHSCPDRNPKTRATARSQAPIHSPMIPSAAATVQRLQHGSAHPAGHHHGATATLPRRSRPRSRRPAPLPPYPAGRRHSAQRSRPPRQPRAAEPSIATAPSQLGVSGEVLPPPAQPRRVFWAQMCISGQFCIPGLNYFRAARLKPGTFS
jgi:hypothetical protein